MISHHCNTRTEIVSAVMKIFIPMPYSSAASERTFSNWHKSGKEHCSELALDTIAALPSVKKSSVLFLPVNASHKVWCLLQVSARDRLVKRRIYSAIDKSKIKAGLKEVGGLQTGWVAVFKTAVLDYFECIKSGASDLTLRKTVPSNNCLEENNICECMHIWREGRAVCLCLYGRI